MSGLLTDKKKMFCREYLIDLNGTQAALRAGYSKKTAGTQAEQLLKKLEVQEYIKELMHKREKRTDVKSDDVIYELAKVAFHNIKDFLNEGNMIKDLTTIEREKTAAVSSIKTTIKADGDIVTEIKFHDKVSALEKLGKHFGIFEKDNEQLRPPVIQVFKLGDTEITM